MPRRTNLPGRFHAWLRAAATAAALLLIAGSGVADERFERVADVQAGGTLIVALDRGAIVIV